MWRNAGGTARVDHGGASPFSGIAAGANVLTLEGELPVEYLEPGDRIVTRGGARVLRSVTVSVLRDAMVVRIGAETLGIDAPVDDLLVSPDQMVLVRDWRARALCGAAAGMVPAAKLVDGEYIRSERAAELRVFALHFDEMAAIYVGGLELGCPAAAVAA